ncbi:MAG: phenylalanine--tRNA ligase subunit beta, partial [Nitrospirae bacterium]
FETLDGVKRTVPSDGLLIWDGERPVALAGIMGGLDTEVTEATVNVFLESAYFEPSSIRKTSRRLGLSTESSYRFERGTDIEGLVRALDRAAFLIQELAGGTVSKRIDVYPERFSPKQIKLRYKEVARLLGADIGKDEIERILEALEFKALRKEQDSCLYEVPTFRVDIFNETDLIEEVARHFGYSRIPSRTPKVEINPVVDRRKRALRIIKETMVVSGFSEAINYSFMNSRYLSLLGIKGDDPRTNSVKLLNPLRKEDEDLRTFLLPSLLDNLINNLNQNIRDIKLFEVSRVFIRTSERLPSEPLHLGAVYLYYPGQRLWDEKLEPFYLLKGLIEKTLKRLNIASADFRASSEPFLHPKRSADVFIDGKRAGFVGVLSSQVKIALGLEDVREPVGVCEIDLDLLLDHYRDTHSFRALPAFPFVQRDISLLLSKELSSKEVLDLVASSGDELIEDYWIFDHYEGKNIPEGMKALGISIRYRAKDRTLTDEEVEASHRKLTEYLLERTGGRLR